MTVIIATNPLLLNAATRNQYHFNTTLEVPEHKAQVIAKFLPITATTLEAAELIDAATMEGVELLIAEAAELIAAATMEGVELLIAAATNC